MKSAVNSQTLEFIIICVHLHLTLTFNVFSCWGISQSAKNGSVQASPSAQVSPERLVTELLPEYPHMCNIHLRITQDGATRYQALIFGFVPLVDTNPFPVLHE